MKEILGTLNVSVDEWRMEMKQLEPESEKENDVHDIAASLENTNLRSPQKLECSENMQTSLNNDTDTKSDSENEHDDEEEGVLLFRVSLALETVNDDKIQVVMLHLEDLRDLAPELLTKFLQSKLKFIDEGEENQEIN